MASFCCTPAWPWVVVCGERAGLGCSWSCSAQPWESSCASPLLIQVPLPCSKGSRCLPGAMQNWLFLSPRHESASPSGVCDGWESWDSHQIASAVLTSVPISQPEALCGHTLFLANPLIAMVLGFRKGQGKNDPQNYGTWILHRAGFPCENLKVVLAYRHSQETSLWAFQKVTEQSLQHFVLNFTRSFHVFCEFLWWLKLRLGSPPVLFHLCDIKQLETSTAVCIKAAMGNSWNTLGTLLEQGLIHLSYWTDVCFHWSGAVLIFDISLFGGWQVGRVKA